MRTREFRESECFLVLMTRFGMTGSCAPGSVVAPKIPGGLLLCGSAHLGLGGMVSAGDALTKTKPVAAHGIAPSKVFRDIHTFSGAACDMPAITQEIEHDMKSGTIGHAFVITRALGATIEDAAEKSARN